LRRIWKEATVANRGRIPTFAERAEENHGMPDPGYAIPLQNIGQRAAPIDAQSALSTLICSVMMIITINVIIIIIIDDDDDDGQPLV
jgi:hypothetical protein